MAPVRSSRTKRAAAVINDPQPNRSFFFQPNLDATAFSPTPQNSEPPQSPQSPIFTSPLTLDNDGQLSVQQSQQSQQPTQPRRNSSFTFLEPLTTTTPIFPLRRQSHITLNGRRSSRSQAARRVVSHAAKKPDGHIPRPPNCFLLYRSWVRQQNKLHGKSSDGTHKKNEQNVSVIVGTLWEDLPEEKKEIFRAEARRLKEEHMKRYPGYKYSPRTKKGNNGHNAPATPKRVPKQKAVQEIQFSLQANETKGHSHAPEDHTSTPGGGPSSGTGTPSSRPDYVSFIPYRRSSSCPPDPMLKPRRPSPPRLPSPYSTRNRRTPNLRARKANTAIDLPVIYNMAAIGNSASSYPEESTPTAFHHGSAPIFDPNYQPTTSYAYQPSNLHQQQEDSEDALAKLDGLRPTGQLLFDPSYAFPPPPSYVPPSYPPPQRLIPPQHDEFGFPNPQSPLDPPAIHHSSPMAIVSADFSRENHQMHDPLIVGSYGSSHGEAPEYLSHDHHTPTGPTYALENWQTYAPHPEGNYAIGDHLQPQQTLHPTDPQVISYHSSYDQHQHHPHSLQNDYTVDFHMHDVKSNHNPDFGDLATSYPPVKNGFAHVARSVMPTYSTASSASSTPDPPPTTTNDFSPYLAVPQPQPARSLDLGRMSITGEYFDWTGAAASSPETIGESTHDSIHEEDLSQPISPYATPMAPRQQAPPLSTASSDHTGPQSPLDPHFSSDLSQHLSHSQPHHTDGMNSNSMASFTPLDFDFPRSSIVGLGSGFGFGSFGGSGSGLSAVLGSAGFGAAFGSGPFGLGGRRLSRRASSWLRGSLAGDLAGVGLGEF